MQKTLPVKAQHSCCKWFNEIEMTTFQRALIEAGASPKLISTESSLAHGWQGMAGAITIRLINIFPTLWRLITIC